jgi:hypothetical protein
VAGIHPRASFGEDDRRTESVAVWTGRAGTTHASVRTRGSLLSTGAIPDCRLQARTLAFIKSYPVLAASGELGPKLREGDRQVPEGLYGIESLNPNSRFHLALRVDYPNEDDRSRAALDGRSQLGGDIMIHGDDVSIGCLAMGDVAAEEFFVVAAEAGWRNGRVLISPVDFRLRTLPSDFVPAASWVDELYGRIRTELAGLPQPR